ncbi:MAG: S-methyl-5-thioribose-1-phosphate isomerase [Bryobacteraceae bacterium]
MVETILWTDSGVVMIDQRYLPHRVEYFTAHNYQEMEYAIKTMVIRGAPAIGVAGAMGVALGFQEGADFKTVCNTLANTRPTAVNLSWGVERMRRLYATLKGLPREEVLARLIEEAQTTRSEDIAICKAIGEHGSALVVDGKTVLTHCNAGALATAGYGTALGVIRSAVNAGKKIDVFADETRPFLQGARLTAWELQQDGIETTVITDNMAGYFMKEGRIGCVVVGADRIAANGDVANKIGTYSVAVLAKENKIPFYVAAPVSTFDLKMRSGKQIEIEQRPHREVTHVFDAHITPEGIGIQNPAFDVTPAKYVTAIICENGVARAPYKTSLKALASK